MSAKAIGGLFAVAITVIAAIILFFGWYFDFTARFLQWLYWGPWVSWLFPNGWDVLHATPFAYFLLAAGLAGLAFGLAAALKNPVVVAILAVIALVYSGIAFVSGFTDRAQFYSQATTVVMDPSEEDPAVLRRLLENVSETDGGDCDLTGTNSGIETCIKKQDVSFDWEQRPSSVTAALKVLGRSSSSDPYSKLMDDTLTYLNDGNQGSWSAIRDGDHPRMFKSTETYGVVQWDGTSDRAEECAFNGDNELKYSFSGLRGTNLKDKIAEEFPDNLFDETDVWGYCEDGKPIIVVPTTKVEGYGYTAVTSFGGLLTIAGSPDGEPVMTLDETVTSGEYPGAVYPASLAERQRESFNSSAGLWVNWFQGFGLNTSSVSSQTDNPSEYLLKSNLDDRLYWVTPLRGDSTDSEQISAYSVTAADEATVGHLAHHTMYVMDQTDGLTDLQRVYDEATNAVNNKQGAFFTGNDDVSGGSLNEFLPVGNGKWQGFAERNGMVVMRVEVDSNMNARAYNVDEASGDTQPETTEDDESTPTELDCSNYADLDNSQLRECIIAFTNELQLQ